MLNSKKIRPDDPAKRWISRAIVAIPEGHRPYSPAWNMICRNDWPKPWPRCRRMPKPGIETQCIRQPLRHTATRSTPSLMSEYEPPDTPNSRPI